MNRSWQPKPTREHFVRSGAKRGETVYYYYDKPPTSNTSTGYTGVAAEHLKRQKKYEQERAKQEARKREEQQEETRKREEQERHREEQERYREEQDNAIKRWYEQQNAQLPKTRSKSPVSPPNCKSSKYSPVRLIGHDRKTKRKHVRDQALIFHPDKNRGCPDEASDKMKILNGYKDEAKLSGGKSKKVSKRASKRTTKKKSGK